MYTDNLVFSQVMEHLPMHTFRRCVQRYHGNHKIKSFTCLDQFRCMAFAQLTYRESLRDIGFHTSKNYPDKLRRIKYHDEQTGKTFIFLTNNFYLSALAITELYRCRWQVELFFKWIKQHLRIKSFFGTTENAVKTQIWTAVAVYVLVAIIKKGLHLDVSLYTILQILSVTIFEKMPLNQVLSGSSYTMKQIEFPNQLILFD